jgi:hypothetical protein
MAATVKDANPIALAQDLATQKPPWAKKAELPSWTGVRRSHGLKEGDKAFLRELTCFLEL